MSDLSEGASVAQATSGAVYRAINAVQAELASVGIGKDGRNKQQGYAFRGIDQVYNVLAPILAKQKLCVLPRVLERECVERRTAKDSPIFYVTVAVEFDFVSAEDGSRHTVKTYGEAMDTADKATNKAMSAAQKYAYLQTFSIPTEGDNDADATTHEIAAGPHPILIELRNAALEGMEGLKAKYESYQKDEPGLRDIWLANQKSLRRTASEVDQGHSHE